MSLMQIVLSFYLFFIFLENYLYESNRLISYGPGPININISCTSTSNTKTINEHEKTNKIEENNRDIFSFWWIYKNKKLIFIIIVIFYFLKYVDFQKIKNKLLFIKNLIFKNNSNIYEKKLYCLHCQKNNLFTIYL